ncbi:hypothetical protein, partial [Anoxybacillus ayderensis]|uniref:hypothetical protein n=1 Tax=Anoxybacillus ayderensis TaxID=265546 RepID=UPI002E1C53EA|nr:hypothetical protein [Anoxybacillus ayderensis]
MTNELLTIGAYFVAIKKKMLYKNTPVKPRVLSKVLKTYPKFLLILCGSRQKKLATPAVFGTIEVTTPTNQNKGVTSLLPQLLIKCLQ